VLKNIGFSANILCSQYLLKYVLNIFMSSNKMLSKILFKVVFSIDSKFKISQKNEKSRQ